jgi:hypothetical protein
MGGRSADVSGGRIVEITASTCGELRVRTDTAARLLVRRQRELDGLMGAGLAVSVRPHASGCGDELKRVGRFGSPDGHAGSAEALQWTPQVVPAGDVVLEGIRRGSDN